VNRLKVIDLPLAGLKIVERKVLNDGRGSFSRLFCAEELASVGWMSKVAQINHSRTARTGTVRGMHFQLPPHAEVKLVSCLRGRVWDVVVDLRMGSDTLFHWHAEELSADNRRALLIPEGFAHGFQTLTDDVELLYCHSAPYREASQGALNPLDPELAIRWPLEITVMSDDDAHRRMIDRDFVGIST